MKVFYDQDGNIVGQVEGATPEIEAGITMPNTNTIEIDKDLKKRLRSKEDLTLLDIKVKDNQVVEKTNNEKVEARSSLRANIEVSEPVDEIAELKKEIEKLKKASS